MHQFYFLFAQTVAWLRYYFVNSAKKIPFSRKKRYFFTLFLFRLPGIVISQSRIVQPVTIRRISGIVPGTAGTPSGFGIP